MINDNNDKKEPWPKRRVVEIRKIDKTIQDGEPFQQRIYLACGHTLYNTYGGKFSAKTPGITMGCRSCYLEEIE